MKQVDVLNGILLAFALVSLSGCAAQHTGLSYRVVAGSGTPLLLPPRVSEKQVGETKVVFRTHSNAAACAGNKSGIDLRQGKGIVTVVVRTEGLNQRPPGWLTDWSASLQDRHCLALGEAQRLERLVAEALPIDLRNGSDPLRPRASITGYTDLEIGYKLRVVGPIFKPGTASGTSALAAGQPATTGDGNSLTVAIKASPDLIGYETSWYAVEARPHAEGSRIVLTGAQVRKDDSTSPETAPQISLLAFAPEMSFFRLFYLARAGPERELLLVAAATPAELVKKSERLQAGSGGCAEIPECILAPPEVAFTPFISVMLNGVARDLSPGAVLGGALAEAGVAARNAKLVLPTLEVRKPYAGRLTPVTFDRAAQDILMLPLSGGEEIRW